MGFSRQEYWSGLPGPPPGDVSDAEIEPAPLTSPKINHNGQEYFNNVFKNKCTLLS